MRRERLGFKCEEGLIVKSPETGIAAKVETQKEGTAVASLMNWIDEINLEMKATEEEVNPSKKKIISGLILFYLAITGIFIVISGVAVGIISGLYFIAMTIVEFYFLLPQIIYSVKHKEEAQYANIFRKAYACYRTGLFINKNNILSVKPSYESIINELNMRNIRQALIGIVYTPLILISPYVNVGAIMIIAVGIIIIFIWIMKNRKLVELSRKINELLVYRKPTDEQIDRVLFGFHFLRKCEDTSELLKWFYFH